MVDNDAVVRMVETLNERTKTNLVRLRRSKNMTQRQLAASSGVSHVGQIEATGVAGRDVLAKIAVALDCDPSEFVRPEYVDAQDIEERQLINCFRVLSSPTRKAILSISGELLRLERRLSRLSTVIE